MKNSPSLCWFSNIIFLSSTAESSALLLGTRSPVSKLAPSDSNNKLLVSLYGVVLSNLGAIADGENDSCKVLFLPLSSSPANKMRR